VDFGSNATPVNVPRVTSGLFDEDIINMREVAR
jgi:hypothetical protein